MKAHKVVLYVVDHDEVGADAVKHVLENTKFANRCIDPEVASVETVDVGEWSDEHPLNKIDTAPAEFERLFQKTDHPKALERIAVAIESLEKRLVYNSNPMNR